MVIKKISLLNENSDKLAIVIKLYTIEVVVFWLYNLRLPRFPVIRYIL